MDPKAAYKAMWTRFRNGEYEDAIDHADALTDWFAKGGFMPAGIPDIKAEVQHVTEQCEQFFDRKFEG